MESKETFRIVRWRENPHLDVVCVNLMEATKYVEEYNSRAGNQECYVDEDIWHPLSYHETLKLEEQITLLTTQRDGYKEQFNEQKRLFDSSQEEVKRLKEEKEAQFNQFSGKAKDQSTKILELEGRVKELTEEVKLSSKHGFYHGYHAGNTPGEKLYGVHYREELKIYLESKGIKE
jgi:archaellum component FlaC